MRVGVPEQSSVGRHAHAERRQLFARIDRLQPGTFDGKGLDAAQAASEHVEMRATTVDFEIDRRSTFAEVGGDGVAQAESSAAVDGIRRDGQPREELRRRGERVTAS